MSGFVCQRVADRGRFAVAFSSYGSGPQGTRALYLLATRLGYAAQRWSQDLAALPAGRHADRARRLRLGHGAPAVALRADEELAHWIEQGGTLLVGGARHYLPEKLGVAFAPEPHCDPAWRWVAKETRKQTTAKCRARCSARRIAARDGGCADASVDGGARTDAGAPRRRPAAARAGCNARACRVRDRAWSGPVRSQTAARVAADAVAPSGHARDRRPREGARDPEPAAAQVTSARPVGVIVRHGQGRVIALASAQRAAEPRARCVPTAGDCSRACSRASRPAVRCCSTSITSAWASAAR